MNFSSKPDREKEIFGQALDLPSAEARLGYLQGACGGDPELLARVQTLLRAHEAADGFLPDTPGATADPTLGGAPADRPEKPGTVIGRYKLLQKVGEGGCGVVYMAEQEEPVRRRVALKVIKLGMDTKEVVARFEAERQALAMMDHPNIARVFDGGTTATGRPYFVMELVRGVPITRYCDDNNLPTPRRLELFSAVCQAVQHAHQKGIIHRDLKPSNVLVTENDGVPVPKVIDFGIAKATQGRLTDATLFTAFEQFIGTPAYMSPEQAAMSSLDVDTRSDIYSLGVLLYELLTGRPPFEPQELVKAGFDEMRRRIREVEPPRPSARLSTLADADRTTVAKLRGIAPADLATALTGDLDWIVMRCLEKDRTRRYETASALALDLQHYRDDQPVSARPPSKTYLLQKLARRHRVALTAAAAIAAALLIGTGVATWQAVRATQAEIRAKAESEKSQATAAFLQSIFDDLGPSVLKGRDTALLRDLFDRATQRITLALPAHPDVQKDLHVTLGWGYYGIGEYAMAETQFRSALALARGQQSADTVAHLLDQQAMAVLDGGDPRRAEPLLQEALDLLRASHNTNDELRLDLLRVLASAQQKRGRFNEANATGRTLLAGQRQIFGDHDPRVIRTLVNAAGYERQSGHLATAETMQREALRRVRDRPLPSDRVSFDPRIEVAECLAEHGQLPEAESLLNEAMADLRTVADDVSQASRFVSLIRLSGAWARQGNQTFAEQLAREALDFASTEFSPNHQFVGSAHLELARRLSDQGNFTEAATQCERALAVFGHTFGRKGRFLPGALEQQAKVFSGLGRHKEALALARDALAARRETAGEDNAYVLAALDVLAQVQADAGLLADATESHRLRIDICRRSLGSDRPQLAAALLDSGRNLLTRERYEEADTALREAWLIEESLGYFRPKIRRRLLGELVRLNDALAASDPDKAAGGPVWKQRLHDLETATPSPGTP